ncbi:unnamed protein product [Caenorhabditis auriculariae]|uniref:Uncharacterized protein n=1 Tax=Caenorhabditis auriculariae TaxID=2777116 RepID=A0A8S1GSA5_9PELO|nr:unnamed protein product [Caenorhabditis auriculariae]
MILLIFCFLPTLDAAVFSRSKRQASLATREGIDAPITLRSLITCLTPGIREHICLGPRVQLLKREKIGLTERDGAAYGYHNGVDIRLLKKYNVPLIGDDTEIGQSIGAVVDATPTDGAVEFGTRDKIFKAWKLNRGGVVEWDSQGAGVDIGSRASVADDLIKLKHTLFGVNVGPTFRRNIVGPYQTGPTKRPIFTNSNSHSNLLSWLLQPWDEYRTKEQRACPWCFAVDPTYPVQRLWP